jgi:acetyl esterase
VKHRRFAGQVHGFFIMVNILPGSAAGRAYVVDAVAEQLAYANRRDDVVRQDGGGESR